MQQTGARMSGKDEFDGFDPARYEDEARARWGDTDAYRESARRTKRYQPADWKKIKTEQAAIYQDAAQAMQAGKKPDDDEVLAIAERHRLGIDRWFYPCSHAMQLGLAEMYESDPRFAANIDKFGAGLTAFLVAAIRANARHQGVC
jgi:MerR family transcriptional regulator, thiopeptide resistance regulator